MLANERPLAVAVAAGFIATHVATIFGFWFHGIGLVDLDFPRFNGYLLFRAEIGDDAAAIFQVASGLRLILGWIVHTFTGIAWALVFAIVIQPRLAWKSNLAKAFLWGAILATLSALWWVPVLFPEFQLGFFSWNLDGFLGVVAIYLWHFIYAANLGLIYNPLSEDEMAKQMATATAM
jgi:hypothetical protein